MSQIYSGRHTAVFPNNCVVFLIGLQIHRPWVIRKWWPAFIAMPKMLRRLQQDPELGLLGFHTWFAFPNRVMVVQYWRSFADLERFARRPEEPHWPAWQRFNRAIGNDGSVGIWHETYCVGAGDSESIYVNMPRFGLAEAGEHVSVSSHQDTARSRIQSS